jgi:hypothetical protein
MFLVFVAGMILAGACSKKDQADLAFSNNLKSPGDSTTGGGVLPGDSTGGILPGDTTLGGGVLPGDTTGWGGGLPGDSI